MKTKINSLESLRGLAAVIVAMYHFPSTSFFFYTKWLFGSVFLFCLKWFCNSVKLFLYNK